MQCKQCPISLVCLSGCLGVNGGVNGGLGVNRGLGISGYSTPYLCPLCGNFFPPYTPLSACSDTAIALQMYGFRCEKRVVTKKMQKRWRLTYSDNRRQMVFGDTMGTSIGVWLCNFCNDGD